MTLQRRRGLEIEYWLSKTTTDRRGNTVKLADTEVGPFTTRGWVIPQRSSKAEVPGQQEINVIRIGISADLTGVTLWSRVRYDGKDWDVAAPPEYRHGTRTTRHQSVDLRQRPGAAVPSG